jgi:hypothetical protein
MAEPDHYRPLRRTSSVLCADSRVPELVKHTKLTVLQISRFPTCALDIAHRVSRSAGKATTRSSAIRAKAPPSAGSIRSAASSLRSLLAHAKPTVKPLGYSSSRPERAQCTPCAVCTTEHVRWREPANRVLSRVRGTRVRRGVERQPIALELEPRSGGDPGKPKPRHGARASRTAKSHGSALGFLKSMRWSHGKRQKRDSNCLEAHNSMPAAAATRPMKTNHHHEPVRIHGPGASGDLAELIRRRRPSGPSCSSCRFVLSG